MKFSSSGQHRKEIAKNSVYEISMLNEYKNFFLFNGISTFSGHLMQKTYLYDNSRAILSYSWENKGVHTFTKSMCESEPNNAIGVRTRYDVTVRHIGHLSLSLSHI